MNCGYNILLITGDHTRADAIASTAGDVGDCGLHSAVDLPNFRRLSDAGQAFSRCYAANPICVPSRASITTGRCSHRCTGEKNNGGSIRPDQPKLAEHFAGHGYRTCAIGKLHYHPYQRPGEPRTLHGFEHAELCEEGRMIKKFGPQRGVEDYRDFLEDHGWPGYERCHGIGNNDVHPATVPFEADLHEEAWVAARANAWIETQRDADKPWMMWASFTKPHPPFDPPAPYDRLVDPRDVPPPVSLLDDDGVDIADASLQGRDPELRGRRYQFGWHLLSPEAIQNIRACYLGLLAFQDAMIGRILDQLEATGQLDRTLVVYTADHGELLGDFGRFFKSCLMDASARVPLIIKPPAGMDAPAGPRNQLVTLCDLLPTFCDVADIPTPDDLDGQSLVPVLGNADAAHHEVVITQTGDSPSQKYMLRTPRWKYVYHQRGPTEELYDAEGDYERTNLAGDPGHAARLHSLREQLIAWCRDHGDSPMLDDTSPTGLAQSPITDELLQPPISLNFGWRMY